MSTETELYTLLTAHVGLMALISGASEGDLPQGATLPYVTFNRVSTPSVQALGGGQSVLHSRPRFQFEAWGASPADRDAVIVQLRAALCASSWTVSFENQRNVRDAETGYWRAFLDAFIAHAGA